MAAKIAYEFAGFRFEPFNARLVYGTTVLPLTPKTADTLTVLVTRPDILITKDDLMAAVWPDAAVEENNLNQQISILRKALAQNGNGSFIETVPRRGYRFVGAVRAVPFEVSLQDSAETPSVAPAENPLSNPSAPPARVAAVGNATRVGVVAVGLLLLTTGTMLASRWYEQRTAVRLSNEAIARGEELMRRGDARAAVLELQEAIRNNPNNAHAHGVLAHALNKQSSNDSSVRAAGRSPSVAAAARGVAMDPKCASCQGTLGFFLFYHDWEWQRGEEHIHEALRLKPDAHGIRPSYAMLLAATGRLREAEEQIDIAIADQPYRRTLRAIRAATLYFQRRYAEAIAETDRALALDDEDRGAWEWRSKAMFQLGQRGDAVRALAQGLFAGDSAELDRAVTEHGGDGGLQKLLERTGIWPRPVEQSWRRGPWRLLLNQRDEALGELERALEYRNLNLLYIAVDPVFDPLRENPRFRRIVAAVGLDSASRTPDEMVRRQ